MINLSINLNKVATLRNARGGALPDIVQAARTVLKAGAHGITVHPRPDQRHITPNDVARLAEMLRQDYPNIEYNIEGNPFAGPTDDGYPGFTALIEQYRPEQATLVPDSDAQLTSDHGWDLQQDTARLSEVMTTYQQMGARVSLFMDPDLAQIEAAKAIGADRIELYTGPFADTVRKAGVQSDAAAQSLATFADAAAHAANIGLGVNAGHDLDLDNLPLFATIPEILEVSIGHALISDALYLGLANTVAAYLAALGQE